MTVKIEPLKAEILSDMTTTGLLAAIDQMENNHFQRMLKSQEAFIHDGTFHMGLWSRWRRASTQEEADAILKEFHDKIKL
jgi:hypothetical protein